MTAARWTSGSGTSHFALNVRGTFLCAQAALRHMAEERYGKVIMIASTSVWSACPS